MGPKGEVRSPFTSIIFTALSCGIYGGYWWYLMSTEINGFLGEPRMNLLKIWGLSTITCGLYGLYFVWVEGKQIIREVQAKAGMPENPPFMCDLPRMQSALNNVWETLP